MKKIHVLGLIAAAVLASAAVASAHGTPCCAAKACPAGQTAEPGATPAQAKCCAPNPNPALPPICKTVANAGWKCSDDVADSAQAAPSRQKFVGCVDGDMGTCVGGTASMGVPAGCIGVGGLAFITTSDQMGGATPETCTNDAVAACCANTGCVAGPGAAH